MALLIFTRPGEVAKLKWSEVDLENRQIVKEASAMKMKRVFVIPLSNQAVSILESLMPYTGHTDYVFYSSYRTGRPISTESLGNALRRNGIDEINPHGFRHTASTALNEMGFDADEIELQLSHVVKGTRGVYNKAEKIPQRMKLMQAWANHLDELKAKGTT
ncbi:MAG: site-specific integrase [Pseudomonadota bacterium]|nr:site-specific integrase [Pseudomonadota bacterium]